MQETVQRKTCHIARVRKNLSHAISLAWAASPRLLIRYSLLGMFNATMPPVSVLVNKIAEAAIFAELRKILKAASVLLSHIAFPLFVSPAGLP